MPWVKISDDFYDHPKLTELSALGIAAWITGLAYCNRNLTDGRIPKSFARRCVNTDGLAILEDGRHRATPAGASHAIKELLDARLWFDEGSCYVVHDYLDYQPSAADVRRGQAAKAERQARWRSRSQSRNASPNGHVDALRDASTDALRDAPVDALLDAPVTLAPVARSPYPDLDHLDLSDRQGDPRVDVTKMIMKRLNCEPRDARSTVTLIHREHRPRNLAAYIARLSDDDLRRHFEDATHVDHEYDQVAWSQWLGDGEHPDRPDHDPTAYVAWMQSTYDAWIKVRRQ